MRRIYVFVVLLGLSLGSAAWADQVTLKNGDRLTGTIIKSDGKTLVMKSALAGEVTLDWAAIQQVTSAEPLHIGLADGRTVVGAVTTSDGKIEVATKDGGSVEAPKESVVTIRSDAEQQAYDASLHPGLLAGWNGGANVGFALTRGNSQTKNLAIAFNAARPTLHDKLSLYATSVYATNDLPGATPSTTANTEAGGIRYDHNLKPRVFAFVGADFMTNGLQDLDLRAVGSAGLGFHAIKSSATTFDLLAGGNYTHESYSTVPKVTHSLAGLTLGEELTHKVGKSTVIVEKLYLYPDLSETGQYRGTFDLGTVTKISKWLGWQNQFGDVYVSNPPTGTKQNDIVLTTGLNFSFTH